MEMVINAVYPWLTSTYAINIYKLGDSGTRLTNIDTQYIIPVKQYAATNFTIAEIDNALANGWITQTEYDETVAYIV